MKPFVWLIWVTCFPIASHFCWRTSAMSIQVVMASSGTSALATNSSNSASCSGVASSGGSQKLRWPAAARRSFIARAHGRRDRLLVELLRFPGREPALVDRRPGAAVLGCQLLGVPGRVAGPRERRHRTSD